MSKTQLVVFIVGRLPPQCTYSCQVRHVFPLHAKARPFKLIDGKIILGGMDGWEVKESTQETELWDSEVRRCEPLMKIKN